MTPQRRDSLLAGQSGIAQKVYAAITGDPKKTNSALDIAQSIKTATGAGIDIHIMRGCLAALAKSGLVREVVPGSYRQVAVKEKKDMAVPKQEDIARAAVADVLKIPTRQVEPMDALAAISARLRTEAAALNRAADELDAQAIAIEERRHTDNEELSKLNQLKALLKDLG